MSGLPFPSAAARLRAAWAAGRTLRVAGAHDAVGARLAMAAGCDAIWASGLEISTAHGVPDSSILGLAEFLDAARIITEAVRPAPVIADCDTGFGDAPAVARLVRLYERAGVAAICLEDKAFPKRNSFSDEPQALAPLAEFTHKLRTVKGAQEDPDFVLVARTEALITGHGVDEALRRAAAFAEAGADAVLIHDRVADPREVFAFLTRWGGALPTVVIPTTFPQVPFADWHARGVGAVIYANQGLRANIAAQQRVWERIVATGSSLAVEPEIAPLADVFALQELPPVAPADPPIPGAERSAAP